MLEAACPLTASSHTHAEQSGALGTNGSRNKRPMRTLLSTRSQGIGPWDGSHSLAPRPLREVKGECLANAEAAQLLTRAGKQQSGEGFLSSPGAQSMAHSSLGAAWWEPLPALGFLTPVQMQDFGPLPIPNAHLIQPLLETLPAKMPQLLQVVCSTAVLLPHFPLPCPGHQPRKVHVRGQSSNPSSYSHVG